MSDGKNPSRLSLALANAATQEIETILCKLTGQLPEGDKKKIVAVLARYIEMVR